MHVLVGGGEENDEYKKSVLLQTPPAYPSSTLGFFVMLSTTLWPPRQISFQLKIRIY